MYTTLDILDEILDSAYEFCYRNLPTSTTVLLKEQNPSFVVPKLIRTTGNKLSTYTTVRYNRTASISDLSRPGSQGVAELDSGSSSMYLVKCNLKLSEYFDGITMFDYINTQTGYAARHKKVPLEKVYKKIGRVCNELFVFLRTQRHLVEKLKLARGDSFPWQVKTCESHLRKLLDQLYPRDEENPSASSTTKRALVERTLEDYNTLVKPQLDKMPEYILHSDLCNRNILLNWEHSSPFKDKLCLIDFQDLQVGQQVIDLAIVMLYNVIEQEQTPFDKALILIPHWIYLGYQSDGATKCPLEPGELALVPTLMKLRLCQSLLNGQAAYKEDTSNLYVMHTNQRGWKLLELMSDLQSDCGNTQKLVSFWLHGSLTT